MMTNVNKICITLILFIAVSCVPDPLPVTNIPKLKPKIVVSSQLVPGQGLVVLITKSLGALDVNSGADVQALLGQVVINNAIVTLHYQDQTDTLLNLGNGVYGTTGSRWQEGIPYELEVVTDSLGTVTAVTHVIPSVKFNDARLSLIPSGDDSLLNVNYSINDQSGKNYYVVSVQKYSSKQIGSDLLNPRIVNHLLADDLFDGQLHTDEFKILFPRFHQGDSVALFLTSVNENYYKFLKVQNDNQFSLVEFISEPMNYPTNVNGGYGFFNLQLPDVRIFTLK